MKNPARLLRYAMVGMLTLTSVGCASIVHSGHRPVMIDSNPEGAQVTVLDHRDRIAYTQTTPCTARLRPYGGYMRGETYRVIFDLPGYAKAEANIDPELSPWYFGNIVFGVPGFVIVDPLTGSMWNLRPLRINQQLVKLPEPPAAPSTNAPPPVSAPVAPPEITTPPVQAPPEVVTPAVQAPSSSSDTNPPAPPPPGAPSTTP